MYSVKYISLLVDIFQYLPSQKKKGEVRVKTAFIKRNQKRNEQEDNPKRLNLSFSPTLLDKHNLNNLCKESQIDD